MKTINFVYSGVTLSDFDLTIDKGFTFTGHFTIDKLRYEYEINIVDGSFSIDIKLPFFISSTQVIHFQKSKDTHTEGGAHIQYYVLYFMSESGMIALKE